MKRELVFSLFLSLVCTGFISVIRHCQNKDISIWITFFSIFLFFNALFAASLFGNKMKLKSTKNRYSILFHPLTVLIILSSCFSLLTGFFLDGNFIGVLALGVLSLFLSLVLLTMKKMWLFALFLILSFIAFYIGLFMI